MLHKTTTKNNLFMCKEKKNGDIIKIIFFLQNENWTENSQDIS